MVVYNHPMPILEKDSVAYFTFEIFSKLPIDHAIFTRRGGVSTPPWNELNVGSTVGDAEENVIENLKRSFNALERNTQSIFDSWLVHGTDVIVAAHPDPTPRDESRKADILISDNPRVTLFMRYADCVPILLYDPFKKGIALVHAGWRGTVRHAVGSAVSAMVSHFGSSPQNILAGIGPSICQDHYEVGADVSDQVKSAFGVNAKKFLSKVNGSEFFDLRKANRDTLIQNGVNQVEDANICTACNLGDWYSHRGEGGRTGRFGAILGIRADD